MHQQWLMQPTELSTATLDGAAREGDARAGDRFLRAAALLLAGYALFGYGVAYLGVAPLYVGELVLAAGLALLLVSTGWAAVLDSVPALLMVLYMAWGLACMLPHLSRYGVMALRDSVIWAYGAWAIIIGGLLIARPERLRMLLRWYRRFVPFFLFATPVLWAVQRVLGDALPTVPGGSAPILYVKAGDIMVHLSGITAFIAADLAVPTLLAAVMVALDMMLAGRNRGGFLSFAASFTFINLIRPRRRFGAMIVGFLALLVAVFILADLSISTGKRRQISPEQLTENLVSIFSDSSDVHLESTKEWRLSWWSHIVHYTFGGRYFWMGKGYGVNLADDDGYQVTGDDSLRSPHSVHMNILARSGVPGLALWVMLQIAWAAAVGDALFRSAQSGQRQWAALLAFLLAYWIAFICNASFDVYLEGPMGGIWFWCVFGFGLGALWIYRNCPEVLHDEAQVTP